MKKQVLKNIPLLLSLKKLNIANKSCTTKALLNKVFYFVIVLFLSTTNTSCVSKKKLVKINNLSSENKALKEKLDKEIAKNKALAKEKQQIKELDSISFYKIDVFLDSTISDVTKATTLDESLPVNKKIIIAETTKKILVESLENVKIISDILKLNTFIRFNTGALFKPGGYIIEDDTWKPAMNAFSPVLDSIINFVQLHPNKKFDATIVILGYSDATAISPTGKLFKVLTEKLNNVNADKATLNLQLSHMRAESVGLVFKEVSTLKTCKDNLYKLLNLTLIPQGRGEEIPDPALINPSDDDERRRAVVVFWNVIPAVKN